MIIRFNSMLARMILRLPLWLPIYMERARAGNDIHTYVKVGIRW